MTKQTKWHVSSKDSDHQSDQSLHCLDYNKQRHPRYILTWVDAQADLSLPLVPKPFCWFCHTEAHFTMICCLNNLLYLDFFVCCKPGCILDFLVCCKPGCILDFLVCCKPECILDFFICCKPGCISDFLVCCKPGCILDFLVCCKPGYLGFLSLL